MVKIYLAVALLVFFIIIVVLGYCLLIPIMSFAGDNVYNDIEIETDSLTANGISIDFNTIELSSSFPMEDPGQWLEGKTANINETFLKRLAALARKFNRKIYISSGYRTMEEQQRIWDERKREHPGEPDSITRKWVGRPGGSRHNYGLAVDCNDWVDGLSNNTLREFGLIKPLPNESWHIEPVESRSGSAGKNGGPENISAAEVLPQELLWMDFDKEKLRGFLNSRDSILADEKYLASIIEVCRKKNVNVLLMLAITGQEQAYVPKNRSNAVKIANNPFNVFHSWYEYNTNIEDSTSIACNTVINLSKNRPEAIHPIQWINRKYAEDKRWWIGVSNCFDQIKKYVL